MEIKSFGTIHFDGRPMEVGSKYCGHKLFIGNTDPQKPIPWVKTNGLYVAARLVCTDIIWDELDENGYITGQPVRIDGNPYLCRSLKVGDSVGCSNEWDDILDATDEDDSLWHWKDVCFWGQESVLNDPLCRAIRGCYSARYWSVNIASNRYEEIGFRPVLEPLVEDRLISSALVGQHIKVHGPGLEIKGTLADVSAYDLFLTPDTALDSTCDWCYPQDDGTIAINRDAVFVAKKA